MIQWCKNCAMDCDEAIVGNKKLPRNDCAYYLEKRFDGSVRL